MTDSKSTIPFPNFTDVETQQAENKFKKTLNALMDAVKNHTEYLLLKDLGFEMQITTNDLELSNKKNEILNRKIDLIQEQINDFKKSYDFMLRNFEKAEETVDELLKENATLQTKICNLEKKIEHLSSISN